MTKIETHDALELFEYPLTKGQITLAATRHNKLHAPIPPGIYPFTIVLNPQDRREEAWFILNTSDGQCGDTARALIKGYLSTIFGESADGAEYIFRYHHDDTEFIQLPRTGGSRISYWAQADIDHYTLPENEYVARFRRGPDDKRGIFPSLIALQYKADWYGAPCQTLFANEKNRIAIRRP